MWRNFNKSFTTGKFMWCNFNKYCTTGNSCGSILTSIAPSGTHVAQSYTTGNKGLHNVHKYCTIVNVLTRLRELVQKWRHLGYVLILSPKLSSQKDQTALQLSPKAARLH